MFEKTESTNEEKASCADCGADVYLIPDEKGMNLFHRDPVCPGFLKRMQETNAKDLGVVDYSYIPDLPQQLHNIEPRVCMGCKRRIWFSKEHRLIYHEQPQCGIFTHIVNEIGGIDLGKPVGEA